MEKARRILSVMLVALIGCITVFQCHHHDAHGHPFFLAYSSAELSLCHHEGHCHNDSGDCAGGEESPGCGMHLDDALATDNSALHDEPVVLLPVDAAIAEPGIELSGSAVIDYEIILNGATDADEVSGFCRHMRLRGPPCV